MPDHHDEYWKHPWAVRLSRIVCNDTLTASPAWHDEARDLVMEIEVQGDEDLLALTRDRAIDAEQKLATVLSALKALVAGVERDDNPRDEGHCEHSEEMNAARAAIAKAEKPNENGVRPSVGHNH